MFDFNDISTDKVSDGYSFVTEKLVNDLNDIVNYYGFDKKVKLYTQDCKLCIDVTSLTFPDFDIFFTVLYQCFKYHADNPFDILGCVKMIENTPIELFDRGRNHIGIMLYAQPGPWDYNNVRSRYSKYLRIRLDNPEYYSGKIDERVNDIKYLVFLIRCSQMVYESEYKNLGLERIQRSSCFLNFEELYPMTMEETIEFVKLLVETEDLINPPKEFEKHFYDGIIEYIFLSDYFKDFPVFIDELRTMPLMEFCRKFYNFAGYNKSYGN